LQGDTGGAEARASRGLAAEFTRGRRRWALALTFVLAGVILWGAWALWSDGQYREAIARIELEMANGRFGIAARDLRALLERDPGSDEAAVLLGRCEKERGRFEAAAKALARVPPGSPFAHQATLARMRLAHDQGQFSRAEEIINDAAADPRNDGPHLRFLLVPIYSQLGLLDEAKRLIEERWEHLRQAGEGASEPAVELVRMHFELDFRPNPAADVRTYLEQASRMAPDDDRVWLGRANLAIRTGDFAEARRRLDACLGRRPEDASVWASMLRLGVAANRVEVVHEALAHLPAEGSGPGQLHRLEAWLSARRGDVDSERRDLESLVMADPADLKAIDRLADLATQAGEPARAAELRLRQAEIRRLLARYDDLFARYQPIRHAVEMAGIAERLGRTFEAMVFLSLAIAEDPDRLDLRQTLERLSQRPAGPTSHGKPLTQLIRLNHASG
jgi:thioredoxin-like negative regulator of GroEL